MTGKKSATKSEWVDPDDAPELTKEWFEAADFFQGGKLVRRGRPKSKTPKRATSIRLDPDVLEHYRAGLLTGSAAARMLGVSRAGFLDFLGARKVPYFGGQHDDGADLADAEDLADTLSGR